MSLEVSAKLDDVELAKFYHDLLLAFMDFTMGIVPGSRMRNVISYIADTMYSFMDFKLLGLIKFNDPMATLERYCHFLEDNYLVKRVKIITINEMQVTLWRIAINYCIFGNSCRNLHPERFICPMALFGGFLVQTACSRRVNLDASLPNTSSCETDIKVWDEAPSPRQITLRG
jgi:hypothetical protein